MIRLKKLIPTVKILAAWIISVVCTVVSGLVSLPLVKWLQVDVNYVVYILMILFWVYLIVTTNWLFDFGLQYRRWVEYRKFTKRG